MFLSTICSNSLMSSFQMRSTRANPLVNCVKIQKQWSSGENEIWVHPYTNTFCKGVMQVKFWSNSVSYKHVYLMFGWVNSISVSRKVTPLRGRRAVCLSGTQSLITCMLQEQFILDNFSSGSPLYNLFLGWASNSAAMPLQTGWLCSRWKAHVAAHLRQTALRKSRSW